MNPCPGHPDQQATCACTRCAKPLCLMRLRGDTPGARLCRDCRRGGWITAVLFLLAFPVGAPGLLYLYLTARRWGRLTMVHWFCARIVGGRVCWVALKGFWGWSVSASLGFIFVSNGFGLVSFIREQHLGRS